MPPQRRQSVNGLLYCPGCREWLLGGVKGAFYQNKLTALGVSSKCKECLGKYDKASKAKKSKALSVEVTIERDEDINFSEIIEGRLAKGTWTNAVKTAEASKSGESVLVKVPKNHRLWIDAPQHLKYIAYKLGILIDISRAENGIVIKFLKRRKHG